MEVSTGTVIALASALCAFLGVAVTQWYNQRRARVEAAQVSLEAAKADDLAADRLLKLIQTEADKRVEIVRRDFELQIAQLKIEHGEQMTKMRQDFERQLEDLRRDHRKTRCDVAEDCANRMVDGVRINADGTI